LCDYSEKSFVMTGGLDYFRIVEGTMIVACVSFFSISLLSAALTLNIVSDSEFYQTLNSGLS